MHGASTAEQTQSASGSPDRDGRRYSEVLESAAMTVLERLGSLKESLRRRGSIRRQPQPDAEDDESSGDAEEDFEEEDEEETAVSARVTSEENAKVEGFRWLRIKKTYYEDEKGVSREWETAERTTRKVGVPDAVFVVAFLDRGGCEDELLLVSQFRPCVDSYVLEFPAGLVDANETAEEAALRELREETGFVGTPTHSSPMVPADAGMSNSMVTFVHVRIDMSLPENKNPVQHLEDTENIKRHYVPRSKLLETVNAPDSLRPGVKMVVDVRLFATVFGLQGGL